MSKGSWLDEPLAADTVPVRWGVARAASWTVGDPEIDVDCEEGTKVTGAGMLGVADPGVGVGVGEGSAWGAAAVVDAALTVLPGMVTVSVVSHCDQST